LNQLLLPRLQLDLGAQRIDVWRGARVHTVCRLIEERLRRLNL
jgi:hypothetical protein